MRDILAPLHSRESAIEFTFARAPFMKPRAGGVVRGRVNRANQAAGGYWLAFAQRPIASFGRTKRWLGPAESQ